MWGYVQRSWSGQEPYLAKTEQNICFGLSFRCGPENRPMKGRLSRVSLPWVDERRGYICVKLLAL
eukprot:5530427-Pyramimonas_sp.AAC.1